MLYKRCRKFKNGRDSNPNRLVKNDGQKIKAGSIIVRQRGTKIHPGKNVKRGNDDTLFATSDGVVKFQDFSKNGKSKKRVTVLN